MGRIGKDVIIAIGVCLLLTAGLIFRGYVLYRDVESVMHRAQVAADDGNMRKYMMMLRDNLEKHHMTEGNSALIFKTPANDLALLYESVNRIIDRLESIKDVPHSEAAYQTALDDLRGTIRELEEPSFGFLFTQAWLLFLIATLTGAYAFWYGIDAMAQFARGRLFLLKAY